MNIVTREELQEERFGLKIKKSTLYAFLSIILYKVVLDLSYYFVISPVWYYTRFTLDLNSLKLVESYLLLIIIFILMPKSAKKLSNIMVWLLIVLSYIPMLTIFAFADEARLFMYAVTGFWLVVFLLMRMPGISLPPLKQSGVIRYSILIGLGIVVFLLIYKNFGISFNFNLLEVYDIRVEYAAADIPLAGYFFNWMAYIVNPIFFALFIKKRKWLPVAIIVFLQVLLFSVTGLKSFLFALPFVLALMWVVNRRHPLTYLAIGFSVVILVGMLSYWLADNIWVSALFTRRTLLAPGVISFCYYDFFSQNDLVFLSASRLGFFASYPYLLSPPNLIGTVYFGNPALNANAGIVGDAFMNFGFIGLALLAIPLGIILKLVDSCAKRVDLMVAVAAIALPAVSLTNGALLTNLLTHGLLLALLLLYLLPKEDMEYGKLYNKS
jgi:hypothetical protein